MTTATLAKPTAPIVFIDDAHTFGGAQIAMAWGIRVVLRDTSESIVCVCSNLTREAVEEVVGVSDRLRFVECPSALPLNLLSFPLRLIPVYRILQKLRRQGVRAWWLNLSGIEFCLAPHIVLTSLGEEHKAWLHNTERFVFFQRDASLLRRIVGWTRDRVADYWLFGTYRWIVTPSRSATTALLERVTGSLCPAVFHLYYPTIDARSSRGSVPSVGDSGRGRRPLDLWLIGRIEYGHKNSQVALDILQILIGQGKEVTLTVVGDGPDNQDFRDRTAASSFADKVTFLGWRKDPWQAVPANAMVFIPSLYESMSLVAREAMMRRIRLVASPIAVFREWIPAAFLAADFQPQTFVAKILEVEAMQDTAVDSLYTGALSRFSDALFRESFLHSTDAR